MSREKIYQMVTDRIIKMIDKGTLPWRKPWVANKVKGVGKRNAITDIPYSGINEMMLLGEDDELYLTFNQIRKHGGRLKKDEGKNWIPIVFWSPFNKMVEGKDGEEKEKTFFTLRYYRVYGLSQTTNVKVPKHRYTDRPNAEDTKIQSAEDLVKDYISTGPLMINGSKACYIPTRDEVMMPKGFKDTNEYYSVLFHELCHSTGHVSRLKRPGVVNASRFHSVQYSKEELIAEMGASFMCSMAGIDTKEVLDNSASYLKGWRDCIANDNKLILNASSQAEKAVKYIIGL